MTSDEFNRLLDELDSTSLETLKSKNAKYSSKTTVFTTSTSVLIFPEQPLHKLAGDICPSILPHSETWSNVMIFVIETTS